MDLAHSLPCEMGQLVLSLQAPSRKAEQRNSLLQCKQALILHNNIIIISYYY